MNLKKRIKRWFPKNDTEHLQDMTTRQLCQRIAGKRPDTVDHVAGLNELRRRQEMPTRFVAGIAILISVISLVVSMCRDPLTVDVTLSPPEQSKANIPSNSDHSH